MPTIPIDLGYFAEYRTMRMDARFGACGEMLPIKLWCFAAKNFLLDGLFPKAHAPHILAILDWPIEQAQEALDLMVQVGFLYEHEEDYGICGWDRIREHVRRSLRREILRPRVSPKLRAEILAIGKCANCGVTSDLELDHIQPLARGGKSDRENLQCLCALCNTRKGAKWLG